MITNTTSTWIKNRICKEVIQIDQHGRQQNKISPKPGLGMNLPGNQDRQTEVKAVMNNRL